MLAVEPGALSTTPPDDAEEARPFVYGTYELVVCFMCSETLHSTGRASSFKARHPSTGALVHTLRVTARESATSVLKRCAAHASLVHTDTPRPHAVSRIESDDEFPAKRSPGTIELEHKASEFALAVAESVLAVHTPSSATDRPVSMAAVLDAGKRAYKREHRRVALESVPAFMADRSLETDPRVHSD